MSHHAVNRYIFIPGHCTIYALHYLTAWPPATTLATSLVQSHLDYANSLLHGTSAANIHKLQCAQNSLSRVVLSGRHREHLSASMRLFNLHWLPVRKCIDFKLTLTTYKILSTHQSAYLRLLLFPHEPTRALRSSSQQLLNVPTVTTDFGRHAFSYCAPKIWNEIPAATLDTFTSI